MGKYPKTARAKQDGWAFEGISLLCYVLVTWPHLQPNALSPTWIQNNNNGEASNPESLWEIYPYSSVQFSTHQILLFKISSHVLIPIWKNELSRKICNVNAEKLHQNASPTADPLVPLWLHEKFMCSFYDSIKAHNIKHGQPPQLLLLAASTKQAVETST